MKSPCCLFIIFALLISGCYPLGGETITGKLTVNPRWGSSIEISDAYTGQPVSLPTGNYTLKFPPQYLFLMYPRIEVYDAKNTLILNMKINSDKIDDDGTFELYVQDSPHAKSFNILGGKRNKILSRTRFSVIRESCTYTETETYSCTDSNGKSSTCTRIVTRLGNQDVVYEKRKLKQYYRILFDGSDQFNAADFTGETQVLEGTIELNSTSCR